jgi:hypothetical protein
MTTMTEFGTWEQRESHRRCIKQDIRTKGCCESHLWLLLLMENELARDKCRKSIRMHGMGLSEQTQESIETAMGGQVMGEGKKLFVIGGDQLRVRNCCCCCYWVRPTVGENEL